MSIKKLCLNKCTIETGGKLRRLVFGINTGPAVSRHSLLGRFYTGTDERLNC